jgi:formylglycine-generating enzyme required for sulfatase activity
VKITKPFYIGTTEVTQEQWETVMGTNPWKGQKYAREGADYPAIYVTWNDAMEYCRKLSLKDGRNYRLPTEAEWEYACRAGSTTMYSFGDDARRLGEHSWHDKTAYSVGKKYAHRVSLKKANAWGLYDIHGNVSEWCLDWFDRGYYEKSPSIDPQGPASGSSRVLRGGSWGIEAMRCRSSCRLAAIPGHGSDLSGFRVVSELE